MVGNTVLVNIKLCNRLAIMQGKSGTTEQIILLKLDFLIGPSCLHQVWIFLTIICTRSYSRGEGRGWQLQTSNNLKLCINLFSLESCFKPDLTDDKDSHAIPSLELFKEVIVYDFLLIRICQVKYNI